MALPIMQVPEFSTKIPSTGKQIKYRPFLVKEEKILLMALEGKDRDEISGAIINLIKSCVLTSNVDVSKLATFDIEYLFLKIRSKSVGEVVELNIGHSAGECAAKTLVEVNLDQVTVDRKPEDGKVMLSDKVGVMLRYPSISDAQGIEEGQDYGLKIIQNCIEYVFDENTVYNEFTAEELDAWIGSLNKEQMGKIAKFFNEMPKLSHPIKWKCASCGKEDSVKIEGLQSFFMLD